MGTSIRNTIPPTIAQKLEFLGGNLIIHAQALYAERHIMVMDRQTQCSEDINFLQVDIRF